MNAMKIILKKKIKTMILNFKFFIKRLFFKKRLLLETIQQLEAEVFELRKNTWDSKRIDEIQYLISNLYIILEGNDE